MVTGQILSPSLLQQMIYEKKFATNFQSAIRLFGTQFVAVRPVPESCKDALYELADPDEIIEANTCYVPKPEML